jgi:hypothetical protein
MISMFQKLISKELGFWRRINKSIFDSLNDQIVIKNIVSEIIKVTTNN